MQKYRNKSNLDDVGEATKRGSELREGKIHTERGSVNLTISTGQYPHQPAIKPPVITTPDTATIKDWQRQPTHKPNLVQTRVNALRGQQEFSPRTTNPPVIKEIDKNFMSVVTRNFNEQVITLCSGGNETLFNCSDSL